MQDDETRDHIAQALGETESAPLQQIEAIITHFGRDRALAWLEETQQVESRGGMLTKNRKRRRTPGGVFFTLVRQHLTEQGDARSLRAIFLDDSIEGGPRQLRRGGQASAVSELPPLTWADFPALVAQGGDAHGAASTVKTIVKGAPTGVRIVEQSALFRLTHDSATVSGVADAFPRPPAPIQTSYAVVVTGKQWRSYESEQAIMTEPSPVAVLEGVSYWQSGREGKGGAFALLVTRPPMPIPVQNPTTRAEVLIVGRPARVERYHRVVVFTMRLAAPPGALPRGLPVPQPFPFLTYCCVVDARRWDKLAPVLAADPADKLVLKGPPVWHAQAHAVVAWMSNVTTQATDRAQRDAKAQAQQAPPLPPAQEA